MILGLNTKSKDDDLKNQDQSYPNGTPLFHYYDDKFHGSLTTLLKSCAPLKTGQAKTFYNLTSENGPVVVVGIGSADDEKNVLECRDESKENIRKAIGGMYLC